MSQRVGHRDGPAHRSRDRPRHRAADAGRDEAADAWRPAVAPVGPPRWGDGAGTGAWVPPPTVAESWSTRSGAAWLGAGVAVTAVTTLLAARQSAYGAVAVAGLAALPACLARPELVALALIPLSVLAGRSGDAYVALLVAAAILALTTLAGAVSVHGGPLARPSTVERRTLLPLAAVGALTLLLAASLDVPGRTALGVPALPNDVAGLAAGLAVLAAATVRPPRPVVLATVVALTSTGVAGYAVLAGVYVNDRLTALPLNPNYLGALIAVGIAAAVGLARTRSAWWLGPAAGCLAALVATHSRGALAAAAVGVVVAVLGARPWRTQVAGAAAAAIALAALFVVASPVKDVAFGDRTSTELAINSAVRADAASVALDVIRAHPLRGIGYGAFPYLAESAPGLRVYINTHDDYLRLAAEAGIATLVVFVALLAAGLTVRGGPTLVPVRAVVAAGAVTLLFVNALSNVIVSIGFWACLGTLLAYRFREESPDVRQPH